LYRCYAKINFTLEILGKRTDGFHELASLVHTVSLADDLRIEAAEELVTCVEGLDIDPATNLVTRAAELLAARIGVRRGAELSLVKRIPAAAGLGGGSSDAATTLVGLNALWHARLSSATLAGLAGELGSDIPFFIRGGAALMRGRGENLRMLSPWVGQWLVLVVPPHEIAGKTRRLYSALEPGDFTSGEMTERVATKLTRDEPVDQSELINGFERAARQVFPGLPETWTHAERVCNTRFFLSGAGPALFTLAADRADARRLVERLESIDAAAHAVRTVKHARTASRMGYP
jgi:4-diphosphocytidyl-2-C-methyl-D-erythritol kinase